MEYPHGHVGHHRHHNHRDDDGDDNYPPPPPQPFSHHSPYPPPPNHQMGGHSYPAQPPHQTYPPPPSYGGAYDSPPPSFQSSYAPPPPHSEYQNYPPAPQPSYDHQPSYGHEGGGGGGGGSPPHRFQPHMPGFISSHFRHESDDQGGASAHSYGGGPEAGSGSGLAHLENKPSCKFVCRGGGDRYAVGIRDGKVVLTHPDHSDPTQHWVKDEKYSTKVKDKDGYPSFMLVNKGTGQAVKHSISCHPVQLAPYRPDVLDESVLWTESKDLGHGFRTIRTVNNIHLVVDAWNADKDHGGMHDGTVLALYETWKGDNHNQQWKITRH